MQYIVIKKTGPSLVISLQTRRLYVLQLSEADGNIPYAVPALSIRHFFPCPSKLMNSGAFHKDFGLYERDEGVAGS